MIQILLWIRLMRLYMNKKRVIIASCIWGLSLIAGILLSLIDKNWVITIPLLVTLCIFLGYNSVSVYALKKRHKGIDVDVVSLKKFIPGFMLILLFVEAVLSIICGFVIFPSL